MKKTSKQFSYVFITINDGAKCYNDIIDIIDLLELDNPNLEYCYIQHNPDDLDPNTHYHIVIYNKGKPKRFSTWCSLFEGAHIEETNQIRYKRVIQYLIHKNNPEKEQYKASDIVTNLSKSLLAEIIASNGYDFEYFNPNDIYTYIEEMQNNGYKICLEVFIKRFGLDAIKNYYFIIKDIIKDYQHSLYLNYKREKLKSNDPVDILWAERYKELKQDYQLAIMENLINRALPFEDFANNEYLRFLDDINKGYYNEELEKISTNLKKLVEN